MCFIDRVASNLLGAPIKNREVSLQYNSIAFWCQNIPFSFIHLSEFFLIQCFKIQTELNIIFRRHFLPLSSGRRTWQGASTELRRMVADISYPENWKMEDVQTLNAAQLCHELQVFGRYKFLFLNFWRRNYYYFFNFSTPCI